MIIRVTVKTKSSSPRIEDFGGGNLLIYVSSEPENNEANLEVISMLSKHYRVSYKNIKIKSGLTNKNKLIEVI